MTKGYTGNTFSFHYKGKKIRIAHAYFCVIKTVSCALLLQFQANKNKTSRRTTLFPCPAPGCINSRPGSPAPEWLLEFCSFQGSLDTLLSKQKG